MHLFWQMQGKEGRKDMVEITRKITSGEKKASGPSLGFLDIAFHLIPVPVLLSLG